MNDVVESITYFASEGKGNLTECLRLSFETAAKYGLEKLVIFTGAGDGIREALDAFKSKPEYSHVRIIGVTFPQGFEMREGDEQKPHSFPAERRAEFLKRDVPLVRAHLPFNAISTQYQHHGVLAQDLSIVGNALNVICGSMSLCIQAVLMACDAGELEIGEHVIVMTSDTSLIVRSSPTTRLLTDLVIRQIICKPAFLTISKGEKPDLPEAAGSETPSISLAESQLELGGGEEQLPTN